jgi:hypothetical protein
MLNFVPIFLLFISIVVIQLLRWRGRPVGEIWLVTALVSLLTWGSLIFLRFVPPAGVEVQRWFPGGISGGSIHFGILPGTWIFAFLLLTLLCVIIFVDAIHLGAKNQWSIWIESILFAAAGLFSIFSQSLVPLVISWTFTDILELSISTRLLEKKSSQTVSLIEFGLRITGTLLIIPAMVVSNQGSQLIGVFIWSGTTSVLILVGAFLRMGTLPLQAHFSSNQSKYKGLLTLRKFVPPLVVFSFLFQAPPPPEITPDFYVLLAFLVVSILFGSIKWLFAKSPIQGLPFWLLCLTSFGLVFFLNGERESLSALAILMVAAGGLEFLCITNTLTTRIVIPGLGLTLMGFPFTPTALLWKGILNPAVGGISIFLAMGTLLLFAGIIRNVQKIDCEDTQPERWMRLFYQVGLGILYFSPWVTLIWNFQADTETNILWAPITCVSIIGVSIVINRLKVLRALKSLTGEMQLEIWVNRIGNLVDRFFSFNWLIKFLTLIFKVSRRVSTVIITMLEGDGGLIWAILFLVLLASILYAGNIA